MLSFPKLELYVQLDIHDVSKSKSRSQYKTWTQRLQIMSFRVKSWLKGSECSSPVSLFSIVEVKFSVVVTPLYKFIAYMYFPVASRKYGSKRKAPSVINGTSSAAEVRLDVNELRVGPMSICR